MNNTGGVNEIGQRTSVRTAGTAFSGASSWSWAYDPLGQITLAEHGTNTNFHRAYEYDNIGNRQRAAAGTLDVNDASATLYTPNALNQYSSIGNLQSTIVNPIHDADGNMTSGPLPTAPSSASSLAWDAENRLISATVGTTTVTYTYDSQSRRIATQIGSNTTLVAYDGWNPIAEWSADLQSATLTKTYTWGMDMSGSMQGAGGIGGLLVVSLITNNSIINHYYPTYDGNGNVSEYLDSIGTIVAHYEYDPFGRTIVESGDQFASFAHRFSTKPQDLTTGLLYYGYRYYDPVTGRWPSRDPIEEEGGINLYGFVGNNGVSSLDYLGLEWSWQRNLGDYLYSSLGSPPSSSGDFLNTAFGSPPKTIVEAINVVEYTGDHIAQTASNLEREIGDSLVGNFGMQGTGSMVDGFTRSSAAMVDGIIPFGDPLSNEYDLNDPGMELCRYSGVGVTFLVGGTAAYRAGAYGLRAAFATDSGYFFGGTWVAGGQQYFATAQIAMIRAQLIGARTLQMTIGGRATNVVVRTMAIMNISPTVRDSVWRWSSMMFARNTASFGGLYGPGGPIWREVERQILQNRGLFPR